MIVTIEIHAWSLLLQKPALGTQRISPPAPAKQAARKVSSAGTKIFGSQKTPAPVKQVKKAASKAQAAAKPSGGLFGTRRVGPSTGGGPAEPATDCSTTKIAIS